MSTQTQTQRTQKTFRVSEDRLSLALWRPRKNGGGCGCIMEYTSPKNGLWLKFIPQEGTGQSFNNEQSVSAKLSLTEIGEMLCVIRAVKNGIGTWDEKENKWKGVFHFPDVNNKESFSVISFERNVDTGDISLSLYVKKNNAGVRHGVIMGLGDIEVLRVLLENSITQILRLSTQSGRQEQ